MSRPLKGLEVLVPKPPLKLSAPEIERCPVPVVEFIDENNTVLTVAEVPPKL